MDDDDFTGHRRARLAVYVGVAAQIVLALLILAGGGGFIAVAYLTGCASAYTVIAIAALTAKGRL